MIFGAVPLTAAEGAILAHSLAISGGRLRKGRVLTAQDIAALRAAGHTLVTVARPGAEDVDENTAAARLAAALVPEPAGLAVEAPFTGRVNLRAEGPGVLAVDADAVAAINAVDPGITLATLPQWQRVSAGMMVATVKIIPYAVPQPALIQAEAAAAGALRLCAPVLRSAALIVTDLGGGTDPGTDKGVRAVAGRLQALGLALGRTEIVPHDRDGVAAALATASEELVLILTASATSDAQDVGPAGLVASGGALTRFGMPVDPGNLLFLGKRGGQAVIGLPGCARSPALNGADWVLERIVCGQDVSAADIAAMGVGGLLKEIPTRPQPREGRRRA